MQNDKGRMKKSKTLHKTTIHTVTRKQTNTYKALTG